MAIASRNRTIAITLAIVSATAIAALYLTSLTGMGMYSTDEPRYADIGRTMARTGDWITPKLWGIPWFEKPALLYWLVATGFKLGLGNDLAPRLPIAIVSVSFLGFFWWRLRYLFDERTASCATGILATTGGWLAYSHVAVTDLPVSAFFTAALLFALPGKDGAGQRRTAAATALGLAVLSKSLPPLILFLPVLIADRLNWRRWFASWPVIAFASVALPWHVLAAIRNGANFLYVLFLEQQLGRFVNNSRQHEQHWWYYAPVFLLLLFPWFPLLPLAFRAAKKDNRTHIIAAVVITGLIFFSAAINKLPGYVLPLVPATCILTGIALAGTARPERWTILPVALIGTLPLAASILPEAAGQGLRATQVPWSSGLIGVAIAAAVGTAIAFGLRSRAVPVAIMLAAAGFIWLEGDVFPGLDRAASARSLWLATQPKCAPVLARPILYGLYYYSEKELPGCGIVDKNAGPAGRSVPTPQ